MQKYIVNKLYKYFWQCWVVAADSQDDAWNNAERFGTLIQQGTYENMEDDKCSGFVSEPDKYRAMTTTHYDELLRKDIDKGMVATTKEYERVYGLPFHDVW